jgi:hypothetical protein
MQTKTANINGLVSLEIGKGTGLKNFIATNWSSGPYFIKTVMDLTWG